MSRLLTKDGICAYLGDISPSTYDSWQIKGIVPGPVRGTNRYDVRAHDMVLDQISGIGARSESGKSPLEQFEGQWGQSHAA